MKKVELLLFFLNESLVFKFLSEMLGKVRINIIIVPVIFPNLNDNTISRLRPKICLIVSFFQSKIAMLGDC